MLAQPVRASICLALLLVGNAACAQYGVVASGRPPEVLAQRVVVSPTDPPELWLALRLAGGAEAGALVLVVAREAEVRPADSAWFSALEAATAVRVVPPDGANVPGCPVSAEAWHDTREAWSEAPATLSKIDRFDGVDAFAAHAEERGLVFEPSLEAQLSTIPDGSEIVAVGFECEPNDPPGCIVSAHFEVSSQREPTWPLLGSERGVATTVWALSDSALAVGARTASLSAVSPVTWLAASSRSDYLAARSRFFDQEPDAWLLESASSATFGSGITYDEGRRIPSLLATYEPSEFDELAELTEVPDFIQRWSVSSTRLTSDLLLRAGEEANVWPIHRWAKLDATGCVTIAPRDDPPPSDDDSTGGICSLCAPDPDPYPEHPEVVSSCSGSTSGSNDGCTGDTSQSGDDGCSSDTSESGDSGCSGDTSESEEGDCSGDSSDSSESSCSGDTSESSDSGCSGDSSGSESGCSGDSADSGSGCSGDVAAASVLLLERRPSRGRRWKGGPMISTYTACALMLPLRRFRRRKQADALERPRTND